MDVDSASVLLKLNLCPDGLARAEWKEGYFSDEVEVPSELSLHLESAQTHHILQTLASTIFSRVESGELKGWPELVDEGFDFKKFLYLINYLLCAASNSLEEEQCRTNGIFAARLYFSLLTVPQGGPFLIFQSNLFSKALRILQCGHLLRVPEPKSPAKRRVVRSSLEDPQTPVHQPLKRSEATDLRTYLNDGLRDLLKTLFLTDIGVDGEAVPSIVDSLSAIAMQETMRSDLLAQEVSVASGYGSSALAMNAFCGLLTLCNGHHGEVEENVRLIMKFVFDAFLLGFKKETRQLSVGHVNSVHDVFSDFVYHICLLAAEKARMGVIVLFQHLCVFSPDRAEYRNKLVSSAVGLMLKLPEDFLTIACSAVVAMSCHEKATVRLFSVEVMAKTLSSLQVLFTTERPEETHYVRQKLLFAALLARIQDSSAHVRSKSMSCLACYLQESSDDTAKRYLVKKIFLDPYLECNNIREVSVKKFKNFKEVAIALHRGTNLTEVYVPCAQAIINELSELCNDDKIWVRKSALQFLCCILHLNPKFIEKDLISDIGSHCRDDSVLVRKMMVQDFTNLLLVYPSNQLLVRQWTVDVVPSIFDAEATVVEKSMESLEKTLLRNMVPFSLSRHPIHQLPWTLMNLMSQYNFRGAFSKACCMWKEETLRSFDLIPTLRSHMGMEKPNNDSAWVYLTCLANFVKIGNPQFILNFYHDEIYNASNVSTYISQLVMEALWLTWKELPATDKSFLSQELNTDLFLFKVPVPLISRAVDIRYGLHVNGKEGSDVDNAPQWAVDLIKKCEESVFEVLKLNPERIQNTEAMKRYVLTLSGACMYYPRLVGEKVICQLLHMLSPQQGDLSSGIDELWSGSVEVDLKAGLIVALGRIGIQQEQVATRLIQVLGSLLSITKESVIKNNIVVCLSDICVRYTSLGEDLLPDMCLCLKDSLSSVRENTLKILTDLIQEDFIKLRSNLLFHLLSMLNDEDFNIVSMTRIFFVNTVLRKKSNYFASSFVPSIFHYNKHDYPQRSSIVTVTPKESEAFDISGILNQGKRQNIYKFMLSNCSDDDRFTISNHLCFDICISILENKINLDTKGEAVLSDCLFVMDCDEICITDNKDGDEDDEVLADEEDVSELVLNSVKKKFISEVVRKHVIETRIPTLLKLRKKLQVQLPKLVNDVTRVLKNTIREHRIDADDIGDSLLAKELKYISRAERSSTRNESSSDEDD